MTKYKIIPSSAIAQPRNRYPKIDWPTDQLEIGQAFVIPLINGLDIDGRSEAYLRVIADKQGRRLGRRFACSKTDKGLAVSRVA